MLWLDNWKIEQLRGCAIESLVIETLITVYFLSLALGVTIYAEPKIHLLGPFDTRSDRGSLVLSFADDILASADLLRPLGLSCPYGSPD